MPYVSESSRKDMTPFAKNLLKPKYLLRRKRAFVNFDSKFIKQVVREEWEARLSMTLKSLTTHKFDLGWIVTGGYDILYKRTGIFAHQPNCGIFTTCGLTKSEELSKFSVITFWALKFRSIAMPWTVTNSKGATCTGWSYKYLVSDKRI
jgi:hypothetical protein